MYTNVYKCIPYIYFINCSLKHNRDDINAAREFHKVAFADLEETQAKNDEELSKKSGLAFDKTFFKANTNKEVRRLLFYHS